MTDYFYQAKGRDDPPELADEAHFADAARRNPYPPEDEAYWAETGAETAEDEQPLWYEDRVRLTGSPPPAPEPSRAEPPPAEPRRRRGWSETRESEAVASPAAAGEGAHTYWADEPAAEAAPVDASLRRRWSLFRTRRAEPEVRAVSPAEAEVESASYAAGSGSSPEDGEAFWYEDRGQSGTGVPPVPPPVPQHRRPIWPDSRGEWAEPDIPAASAPEDGAGSYWTEQAAEPGLAAESWRDDTADPQAVAAAGWEGEQTADDETGTVPSPRAYVPGAAAAAARAAAEAGERNIRFDPTKERGPAYYDHAARHSRHVRILRIALPTIAVLSVLGFFAVMSFDADDGGLPALSLSGINFEQREITMDKPHISGFDGTKRAYEVHAAKAIQALGNAKVVTLETITAKFALGDKGRANLEAAAGVYDGNTQKLKLSGGIDLTTTDGYTARLDDADIDVEAGNVASDTGVVIRGKEGSISADSIEVLERGKHVFFRGNVKVFYQPPETAEKDGTGGTAETAEPGSVPATIEAASDGST